MMDKDGHLKVIDVGYMNQNDADDLGLMEYDFSKRPVMYDTSLGVPYPSKMQAKQVLEKVIHAESDEEKPVILRNNPVYNIEDFYLGDIGHSQKVKPMIDRIKFLEEKLLVCHCIKKIGTGEATKMLENVSTDPVFSAAFHYMRSEEELKGYMQSLARDIRSEFSVLKKQVDRDFARDSAMRY